MPGSMYLMQELNVGTACSQQHARAFDRSEDCGITFCSTAPVQSFLRRSTLYHTGCYEMRNKNEFDADDFILIEFLGFSTSVA